MTENILNNDAPLENKNEDLLGTSILSNKIKQTIVNNVISTGCVIGLTGEWGSGKSTILSFIYNEISEYNENSGEQEQIIQVRFNPWMISSEKEITTEFFKTIEDAARGFIAKSSRALGSAAIKAIADKADDIADYFSSMAERTLPTIAKIAAPFDLGVSVMATTAVKLAANKVDKSRSLNSEYQSLKKKLEKEKIKILVYVDDIDRLDKRDVISVFRIIKSVGNLPYLTYLIAYDECIVKKYLDDSGAQENYIEKIIQYNYAVPKPSRITLLKMFEGQIGNIYKYIDSKSRYLKFEKVVLSACLKTPRDVVRFANSVRASVAIYGQAIDIIDLMSIEAVRMFSPNTFKWIQDYGELLFSLKSDFEADYVDFDNLYDQLKHELAGKKFLDDLVCDVFPIVSFLYSHYEREDWMYGEIRGNRLSNRGTFLHYFNGEGRWEYMMRRDAEALLKEEDDVELIASIVVDWINKIQAEAGETFINQFIEFLVEKSEEQNIPINENIIATLICNYDAMLCSDCNYLRYNGYSDMERYQEFIVQYLSKMDSNDAKELLLSNIDCITEIDVISFLYLDFGARSGLFEDILGATIREAWIDDSVIEKISDIYKKMLNGPEFRLGWLKQPNVVFFVADCILGRDVATGLSSKYANLSFDHFEKLKTELKIGVLRRSLPTLVRDGMAWPSFYDMELIGGIEVNLALSKNKK